MVSATRTAAARRSKPASAPERYSAYAVSSAARSGATSPRGTTQPDRSSTVSGSPPASLTMHGTPSALASTAAPWFSDSDGLTLTSAAAYQPRTSSTEGSQVTP